MGIPGPQMYHFLSLLVSSQGVCGQRPNNARCCFCSFLELYHCLRKVWRGIFFVHRIVFSWAVERIVVAVAQALWRAGRMLMPLR